MKKAYASSEETGLPFSEAVEANELVFVSGQIHLDENGELLNGSISEKTHQAMRNVENVLKKAGLTFDDVIKMEIYLPSLNKHKDEVGAVYETYFNHPYPVRAMLGVKDLPFGADIELTAIAVRE